MNWENGLEYAGTPVRAIGKERTTSWEQRRPEMFDVHATVQADPNDHILLEMSGKGIRRIHAHQFVWYYTIDSFLYTYYQLQEQKAAGKYGELQQPGQAEIIMDRYLGRSKNREKVLPPIVQLDDIRPKKSEDKKIEKRKKRGKSEDHGRKVSDIRYCIKAPIHIANAVGDLWWRWIRCRSNATAKQNSLYFDGLPVRLEDELAVVEEGKKCPTVRAAGKFTLSDYIYFEMMTGISLSIEITAALLEFEDASLRKKALEAFERDALEIVVASPMLFTRICSARSYFHQLWLEMATDKYMWKQEERVEEEKETWWDEITKRALVMVKDVLCFSTEYFWGLADTVGEKEEQTRKMTMKKIDNVALRHPVMGEIPDEEIEKALAHLTSLISGMKKPVDLIAYVKKPKHGLAIFCNPEHENIKYFLNNLKKKDEEELTEIPKPSKEEKEVLFREVHAKVREKIWARISK